jgi:RNA polymerase sigma-70 factor (ECF subfamily)
MSTPAGDAEFRELLPRARAGDREAMGQLLVKHRGQLLKLATQSIEPELGGKLGASDIVQETLCEAGEAFAQFQGSEPAEFAAWLRLAMLSNLRDQQRRFAALRRNVRRESPLADNSGFQRQLQDEGPSPSTQVMHQEQHDQLDQAVGRLPARYREVIWFRHRDNLAFDQIALEMGLSENATRKLWVRAVRQLREQLAS